MNFEELCKILGLTDENAETLRKFLSDNYVDTKTVKELNANNAQIKKQLEALQKDGSNIEDLKKKISELEATHAQNIEAYETKIKEAKINHAIELKLHGKVHDLGIVTGLLDKSKITFNKDGAVEGLNDQLDALRRDKSFLFLASHGEGPTTQQNAPQSQPQTTGSQYKPTLGSSTNIVNPFKEETFNLSAIRELYKTNPEQAKIMAQEANFTF